MLTRWISFVSLLSNKQHDARGLSAADTRKCLKCAFTNDTILILKIQFLWDTTPCGPSKEPFFICITDRYFRLSPLCRRDLLSGRMLRSVLWQVVIHVSWSGTAYRCHHSRVLRNVGNKLPIYTAQHPRRSKTSLLTARWSVITRMKSEKQYEIVHIRSHLKRK